MSKYIICTECNSIYQKHLKRFYYDVIIENHLNCSNCLYGRNRIFLVNNHHYENYMKCNYYIELKDKLVDILYGT